jgi:ankyrin repeat protein
VLVRCAKDGREERVRQLLRMCGPALVDEPDSFRYSALFAAVLKGREGVVRLLIACGADINKPRDPLFWHQHPKRDWPLLNCCAMIGRLEIAALLLAARADVDALCAVGNTPLRAALTRCDHELTALMITAGANLTLKDSRGLAPLSFVISQQRHDVSHRMHCALLISAGAPFDELVDESLIQCIDQEQLRVAQCSLAVARRRLGDAKQSIAREQIGLIRNQAFEICVALQLLALPAYVTMQIVDHACLFAQCVALHSKWRLVVLIKHFNEQSDI